MTHWKTQFNYQWLGSYCLPDGKDIILTIKEMKREDVVGVSGKKELLLVAYFHEGVKPMVVNKTNCKALEKLFRTPAIEDWADKQIQVGSSRVDAFGDKVDALRVRPFLPKPPGDDRPTVTTGSAVWKNILDGIAGGYTVATVMTKYKLTKEQIKTLQQHEIK